MEHLDLINKIIEAEQRAQQMAEQALQKRESMQEELKEAAGGLRETYFERANVRLEKVRERETLLADEQIKELEKRFERDSVSIERAFAENQDAWAETLFQRIVNEANT